MYIFDDGIRLNAKLEKPSSWKHSYPLVIVIHGFTGHMEERHITAVSRMLNEIGCATLRVDMYGHGNSGGDFGNHTLHKWLSNALTVIDYARSIQSVSNLYLCGHSQGGLTVMLAAALKHDVIEGIIPMSPAISIPEGARMGNLLGICFDPEHVPEQIISEKGWVLNGNYIRVAQSIHVEEAVERFHGGVCLVHGSADETIPVEYSVRAAEAYADAALSVIPGDTHCYDYHLDLAIQAVEKWMLRRISG